MAGYTKLFSSIVHSTIWREPPSTKVLWVTMLALADQYGEVMASVPGLADIARITLEECEESLEKFMEPDPYSRTTNHEGRRIEKIQGGWHILNHGLYRDMQSLEHRKEVDAARQRRHRASVKESVTVTVGHDLSLQAEAYTNTPKEKPTKAKRLPWKAKFEDDILDATSQIMDFWPDETRKQPGSTSRVPRSSGPQLASRLAAIKSSGGDLDVCLAIAKRAVEDFEHGKWAKAAENFFGKVEDAPWKSYYQAHVTNEGGGNAS